MSAIALPETPQLEVPRIELPWETLRGPGAHGALMGEVHERMMQGVLGETARPWRRGADRLIRDIARSRRKSYRDGLRMFAGYGGTYAAKVLDHSWNDGTLAAPAPYLALGTGAISDSDIGATFGGTTEANYTGYLRILVAAADMSAGVAGSPATKTNTAIFTFGACTAGSSVVIAWCTVNGTTTARLNAGDVIFFGTVTSVTIDTSHTPPTIAASAISTTLE